MKTVLLLALITFAEATIGVFVKLTGDAIPIQTLNFYAVALAALFLMGVMPFAGRERMTFPRDNLRDTAIIGVLIAIQISVFNFAMTLAPIANVVIFWSIAPFFTFIFSALFLGEKARRSYIFIFGVAFVGILIANPLGGDAMLGNLIALADGAIYAGMVTYMRHEGKTETGNDIAWSMLVAAIILAPTVLIAGPGNLGATQAYSPLSIELPVLIWAFALGVGSYGLSYFGISKVLKRIRANSYSLVDIIVSPIVATILGFLIFGERPAITMLFGGGLLLGAGFWLTREMSKAANDDETQPSESAGQLAE